MAGLIHLVSLGWEKFTYFRLARRNCIEKKQRGDAYYLALWLHTSKSARFLEHFRELLRDILSPLGVEIVPLPTNWRISNFFLGFQPIRFYRKKAVDPDGILEVVFDKKVDINRGGYYMLVDITLYTPDGTIVASDGPISSEYLKSEDVFEPLRILIRNAINSQQELRLKKIFEESDIKEPDDAPATGP